jgi:outer membrane lipoprotein-sorting protein
LRRRHLIALLALAALPAPQAALAASNLAPEQQALVDKAAAYIQDLKTVRGRFTQVDGAGQTTTGVLYLQRPGKARFEYDPPAGMLVVSDGFNVAVSDRRLKTWNIYPLDRTPLVLLLARHVRLDRGVVITNVEQTPAGFVISARDGRRQADGRITMVFGDGPMSLKGWTITDPQGRETRVSLGPLAPAEGLDPNLFNIRSR